MSLPLTVKIQFDNTSTCKYSILLNLCSIAMVPLMLGPPYSKILDPPLISGDDIYGKNVYFSS